MTQHSICNNKKEGYASGTSKYLFIAKKKKRIVITTILNVYSVVKRCRVISPVPVQRLQQPSSEHEPL